MAYTDSTEMLAFVRSLTSITSSDPIIQRKLEDSAGTDPNGVKTYRPYYVSAKLLQQSRADQSLKSADGVVFSNLETMIASLMGDQLAIDRSLNLTVPNGFAAVLGTGNGGSIAVMSIMS